MPTVATEEPSLSSLSDDQLLEVAGAGPKFETQLSPAEEKQYAGWKQVVAPNDSGFDYDYRGAFKAGAAPDNNGHWPDTWKKPVHPTFSDQSTYAKDRPDLAGTWEGDAYVSPEQKQLRDMSDDELAAIAVKQGLMQPDEAAEAVRQKKQRDRAPIADAAAEAAGMAGNIPASLAKLFLTAGGRPGDVAAQVVTPILGGVAGGAAGTAAEPGGGTVAGALAGRAAGGALGDTLAQAREYFRGERDTFGKGELAVNTALSAIPLGGALLKTPARVIATRALQGGALGAAGETARQAIDERQLDFKGILAAGGLGALFGAGGGGVEAIATRRAVLKAIRQTPEFRDFDGNDSELVQAVRDRVTPRTPEPGAPRNVTPAAPEAPPAPAPTEPVPLLENPPEAKAPTESAGPSPVPAPPGPEVASAGMADIPRGMEAPPAAGPPAEWGDGARFIGQARLPDGLRAFHEHPEAAGQVLGHLYTEAQQAPPAARQGIVYHMVDPASAAALQQATGLDLTGYMQTADNYALRHVAQQHGSSSTEEPRGQLPVTAEDIAKLPAITRPENLVRMDQGARGQPVLVYQQRENGTIYAAEEVRTGRGELALQTLYKSKAQGGTPASPSPGGGAGNLTPETTGGALAPESTIPPSGGAVKPPAADPAAVDYQYTVQRPLTLEGGKLIPGYTQIDELHGGKNTRSSNLETLRKEGVDLPDVPGHLPSGRYTLAQIRAAAAELAQHEPPRTAAMGAAAPRPSAGAQRVQQAQLRVRMTQQNAAGLPAAAATLAKAVPAVPTAKWFRGIRAIVAPQTLDDHAHRMSLILRSAFGRQYQAAVQADHALQAFRKEFDRTPVPRGWIYDPAEPLPRNYEVMSRIDTGRVLGLTPSEQMFVKVMRAELDRMIDWVHQVSPHSMRNLMENYMARVWRDPAKNQDKLNALLGHSPLEGPKTFLKQRVLAYFTDGLKLGLIPASDNPVDLTMQKIGEIARFASTRQAMAEAKAAGLRKFKYVYEQMPAGWRAVDDPSTEVWKPPTVTIKEAYDAQLRAKTLEMLQRLGIAHERVTKLGGQRWGEANEVTGIKTKFGGLDAVFWHEAGHMLDWRFPELRTLTGAMDRGPKGNQMRALADLRFEGQQVTKGFQSYVRKTEEKIANMFDAYIRAPDRFQAVAPDVWRDFKGWLQQHPEVRVPLDASRPGLTLGSSSQEMFVGGPIKLGDWIMPEGAAQVLRNYLQPGLGRYGLFRGIRDVAGLVNGMQLIGLFHLALVTLDSVYSGVSMALYDAMQGKPARALGELKYMLPGYGQVKLWQSGQAALGAIRNPSAASAASKQIADLAMRTNLRAGHGVADGEMARQWGRAMREVWQQPSTGAAFETFWRTPFALMQTLMVPVMRGVVPRLKLAVFARMAERVLADNPNASQEELDAKLAQAADATENRLGQVTYDNLFMNRVLKDVLQVLLRAAGWQITKWRMIGHAAVDWARAARDAASGKKPTATFDMTYMTAMLAIHAMIAATLTYLLTGHSPKELLDYIFPDTGLKDPQTGRGVRMSIPDYEKDIYADIHYFPDPKMMAVEWSRKLAPGWSMAAEMAHNHDYFGTQIFSERLAGEPEMEHLLKNLGEGSSYLARSSAPFSLTAGKRFVDAGANPALGYAAPILGFTPAPRYATETPMQNFLSDQRGSKGYMQTQEQAQHAQVAREISQALRDKRPLTAEQQVAMRTLSKQQLATAEKRASMDPDVWAIRGLDLDTAMRAWDLANRAERQKIGPILTMKVTNAFKAGGHDPATLKRYLRVLSQP